MPEDDAAIQNRTGRAGRDDGRRDKIKHPDNFKKKVTVLRAIHAIFQTDHELPKTSQINYHLSI